MDLEINLINIDRHIPKYVWWRIAVVALAFLTGLFDVLTTHKFFKLESNPIMLFTSSFWVLILVKVAIISLLSYQYLFIDKEKTGIQFLLCAGMVLLIIIQIFAGINNLQVAQAVGDQEISTLTTGEKLENAKSYMTNALVFFYYPLMISMFSFIVYQNSKDWRKRK